MAITHETFVRNTLVDRINILINTGSANPGGRLIFRTAADAEVATVEFSDPALDAAVDGVAEANAITEDTNTTGGTVTKFVIVDRDENVVLSGTVTATGGGGDIELTSTTVGAGDTLSVTSLTYEAPV